MFLVAMGSTCSRTVVDVCLVNQVSDYIARSIIVFGGTFSCAYLRKWSLGNMRRYGHSTTRVESSQCEPHCLEGLTDLLFVGPQTTGLSDRLVNLLFVARQTKGLSDL